MADLDTVRAGLAAKLATIAGLRVYETAEERIAPPAVVITPGEGVFIEYDTTMDGDSHDLTFLLHLFIERRSDRAGQENLDPYVATSGAQSIPAAINGVVTGTQYAVVARARNYGDYTYAGDQLFGCEFEIEVGVA